MLCSLAWHCSSACFTFMLMTWLRRSSATLLTGRPVCMAEALLEPPSSARFACAAETSSGRKALKWPSPVLGGVIWAGIQLG